MVQEAAQYTMQAGEVAKRLGVSRETVHNYAQQGVLSFESRVRGRTEWKYFNPEEVEAFATKHGIKPV